MRKPLFLLALMLLTQPLVAQDGLRDMIEARRVHDYVFISMIDDSLFYYQLDSRGDPGRSKRLPGRATIRVEETDGFGLLLGFRNPLHYTWSVGQVDTDDASYASTRKFVDAISSLFTAVGGPGITAPATPASSREIQALVANVAIPVAARDPLRGGVFAPGAIEWFMWLPERVACISEPATLINAFTDVDQAFYGAGKEAPNESEHGSTGFFKAAMAAFKAMEAANSVTALESGVQTAEANIAKLKTLNEQGQGTIRSLDAAMRTATFSDRDNCSAFDGFSRAQAVRLADDAVRLLDLRVKTVAALDSLRVRAGNVLRSSVREDAFRIADVRLSEGKMKELTLTVVHHPVSFNGQTISVEKRGEVKTTLVLREAQTFLVEFAPGATFTQISYPKYGTTEADGQTLVARAGDNVQRGAAVGMLNVIPNFRLRGFFYPLAQIGVGTGKEYPLLMAGGGFRLARPFSLSLTGGAAWTWNRDLRSLKVGDQVAGTADIEQNLEYRFQTKPHFYLGVQNSF
jgi:hypothetical protein